MSTVLAPGAGRATSMIFGPGLTTTGRLMPSSGGEGEAASAFGGGGTATTGTGAANGTGMTSTPGSPSTACIETPEPTESGDATVRLDKVPLRADRRARRTSAEMDDGGLNGGGDRRSW